MAIVAEATLSAPHVTDTEMPATEMSTRSPGVQLEMVTVMVPPGATVGGLTVTTPGRPPYGGPGGLPLSPDGPACAAVPIPKKTTRIATRVTMTLFM